jgi:mRNA-degrading endonuclease RelE of RelBE toxin-antitoxin system
MQTKILPSRKFKQSFKRLSKKYASLVEDYMCFEKELLANPHLGVSLGGGYHKVRLAIRSKGKGKSGGARIITCVLCLEAENDTIVLVDIYDKAEQDDLQANEYIKILRKFIDP